MRDVSALNRVVMTTSSGLKQARASSTNTRGVFVFHQALVARFGSWIFLNALSGGLAEGLCVPAVFRWQVIGTIVGLIRAGNCNGLCSPLVYCSLAAGQSFLR